MRDHVTYFSIRRQHSEESLNELKQRGKIKTIFRSSSNRNKHKGYTSEKTLNKKTTDEISEKHLEKTI